MESIQDKEKPLIAQLRNAVSNFSNPRIIERILTSGVDINQKVSQKSTDSLFQPEYCTVLHLAATQTSVTNFKTLLDHGADIAIQDSNGLTALHWIIKDCLSGDTRDLLSNPFISSALLAHIDSNNFVNPRDDCGFTHFHVACMVNHTAAVEFFLNNGVSVNQAVSDDSTIFPGFTPLHFAAKFACCETAEILIEQGANARLKDTKGMTPIHVLVERKIAMLESLDVEEKLGSKKSLQALLKKINDNEDILSLLLDYDSTVDNVADGFGMTKHHAICTLQKSAVAARLLENVTDINACINLDSPIWPGYTMLHFAAHCNVRLMQLLLEKGANIQAKDANAVTPFEIFIKWCKMRDLHSIMSMISLWNDLTFSDGKTKLLDCIAAMASIDQFEKFMQDSIDDANIFLPADSPLWPGSTLLHLSVIFAERFTMKDDSGKQSKVIQSLTSEEINSHIVKACLDFGTSITSQDVRGRTSLHLAFRMGKSRVVDMLLNSHNGNTNPVDDEDLSYLHIACAMRKKWVIEEWQVSNVDVNIVYTGSASLSNVEPGWTPLHAAVSSNADSSVAQMLLDHGADPYRVDKNNLTPIHLLLTSLQIDPNLSKLLLSLPDLREISVGDVAFTHLHVASYFNHVEAVNRLIDLGTNIDAKSSLASFEDCTSLHLAMMNKSMSVVDVLVRRGADVLAKKPNSWTPLSEVLTSNEHGKSLATFVAILRSNESLRRRVEVELGLTILHVACRAGQVDAVKDFLNKGADVNAKLRDDSTFWPGWTPLHVLAAMDIEVSYQRRQQSDFKLMLTMLLDHGAQVTTANAFGDTPLHLMLKKYPSKTGYFTMTKLLGYQKNFNVNPVNKVGLTHFHVACLANNLEAVEKFLSHGGIDVNQPIDYFANHYAGSTPLHLALNSNSKRYFGIENQKLVLDLLLKYKPNLRAEDDQAYTPIHVAADCDPSCVTLLEKLVENGADINAQTIDGKTAFELILSSKEISLEEIKFFVKQQYRINGCNQMTDIGYLSLILNEKDVKLRNEILQALMETPNIIVPDEMGRTAIHNVVATNDFVILEHNYVDLIDKLAKLGCDINEQDKSGMTALHMAVLFRNKEATTALLICGVDINIRDISGKTAFSYAYDPCTHCFTRCITAHDDILKVLAKHVYILKFFGLYVSDLNEEMKVRALENKWIRNLNLLSNITLPDDCDKKIDHFVIGPRGWTLRNFLHEYGAVQDYKILTPAEQSAVDHAFEGIDYHGFRDLKYILKIQYRQAVVRGVLIKPAISAIKFLIGLPDLCAEAITWYLRNADMKSVVTAADMSD